MTECKPEQLEFTPWGDVRWWANSTGGMLSSDGGGLLLSEV
jgi:hypothetical protein